MDIFLLSSQATFWAYSVYLLWSKNRYYSVFCMVVYLYLLPTEITYRFYPDFYNAYWGPDIWYEFYWFINFSLVTLLVVLNRASRIHGVYNVVRFRRYSYKSYILFFVLAFSMVATYLLVKNLALISYQSLTENGATGNEDTMLVVIDQVFKWLPSFVIYPLVAMTNKKWYMQLFIIYNIFLFFIYNVLSGSRSDILAVTIGLVLLWMYDRKIKLKQILMLSVIAIAFLYLAGMVYTLRGGSNDGTLAEVLLKQDYTAPAYNLAGVIGKNVVDPLMVVHSQLFKTFPMLGGDWLYILLGDNLFPESQISASQSWGFHPFTEGYLFAGFIGFLYNGLVIGFALAFLNRFMSTNDKNFNRFIFAIIGSLFFALVREQSINFFRAIYFTIIPSAFIYSRLYDVEIHYLGLLRKPLRYKKTIR